MPEPAAAATAPAPPQLVRWPGERHRREDLARLGVPRLLLVEAGAAIPEVADDEDWIRVPAGEHDLWARMAALARAAERRRRPRLLDGVVLDHGGRTVVLARRDTRLARLLVDRYGGGPVTWDDVRRALAAGRVARTAAVERLLAAVAAVGLTVVADRDGVELRPVAADGGGPP